MTSQRQSQCSLAVRIDAQQHILLLANKAIDAIERDSERSKAAWLEALHGTHAQFDSKMKPVAASRVIEEWKRLL